MNTIYKPQYNLFVIPLEDFQLQLKEWFLVEKEIHIDFTFSFEYPERGVSKMGDLYFQLEEEKMSPNDVEKIRDLYVESSSKEIVGNYIFKDILKDFFNETYIHYDFDANTEKIHIRTKIDETK